MIGSMILMINTVSALRANTVSVRNKIVLILFLIALFPSAKPVLILNSSLFFATRFTVNLLLFYRQWLRIGIELISADVVINQCRH